jgi:hypothetical protein
MTFNNLICRYHLSNINGHKIGLQSLLASTLLGGLGREGGGALHMNPGDIVRDEDMEGVLARLMTQFGYNDMGGAPPASSKGNL